MTKEQAISVVKQAIKTIFVDCALNPSQCEQLVEQYLNQISSYLDNQVSTLINKALSSGLSVYCPMTSITRCIDYLIYTYISLLEEQTKRAAYFLNEIVKTLKKMKYDAISCPAKGYHLKPRNSKLVAESAPPYSMLSRIASEYLNQEVYETILEQIDTLTGALEEPDSRLRRTMLRIVLNDILCLFPLIGSINWARAAQAQPSRHESTRVFLIQLETLAFVAHNHAKQLPSLSEYYNAIRQTVINFLRPFKPALEYALFQVKNQNYRATYPLDALLNLIKTG
jgi:hypothetical protein